MEQADRCRSAVVPLVPGYHLTIPVRQLGRAYPADQRVRPLGCQDVQQPSPVEQAELVDRTGWAIRQQGEWRTRSGPVNGRLPVYDSKAARGSAAAIQYPPGWFVYSRCLADRRRVRAMWSMLSIAAAPSRVSAQPGDCRGVPLVADDVNLAAPVENERAVAHRRCRRTRVSQVALSIVVGTDALDRIGQQLR